MVESAFAWIQSIVEWFGRFIPRREILDTTVGAIKYHKGDEPIYCGPGIHWYWPWRSTWVIYPMVRQVDRLETQTMETTDGRAFLVGGIITYKVEDLLALMTTTHSPQAAVIELSASALHDVCCEYTWDELQQAQRKGTLKTALRNEAQKQLKEFGVVVLKMQLTNLARCRVYKISQSTASEET